MGARARLALVASIAALALVAAVVVLAGPDGDGSRAPSSTTATSTTSTSTVTTGTTSTTRPPSTVPTTAPPSTDPAIVVRRGPTTLPVVALTFDAGSDTGYAAAILDTLRSNGIVASFGITGRWAEANPDLVRRMVAEGHQLLNHSYDHPSFTGVSTDGEPLPRAARLDQLARTESAIDAAAGAAALPWFRPPYGDEDESVRVDVGSVGYRYVVLWTVDSLGWQGLAAPEIVQRCLERAEPGAIYLLHVGSASADAAALQPIIDGLRARGYGFVSVEELLAP